MNRNAYVDNMKGWLILLVVIGHVAEPMRENLDVARQIYMFIYMFHMPAFAFLSGCFSAGKKEAHATARLFIKILAPYIVFQALFLLIRDYFNPLEARNLIITILTPQYALWYIFCLFFWKAILPYFMKLPYPLALSILIGLLSGFLILPKYGLAFSSSRMLAFFPFFVLGYQAYTNKWFPYALADEHKRKLKTGAMALLLCALGCSIALDGQFQFPFWYHKFYFQSEQSIWICFVLRAVAYLTAFLVGFSFMLLIPRQRTALSRIGERSLYIYLLHSLLLFALIQSGFLDTMNDLQDLVLLSLSGVVLAAILATDFFQKLARPLIEPAATKNLWSNGRSSKKP